MGALRVPLGLVFPESILDSEVFAVLATFVAINTVMYAALAIVKVLPKAHVPGWLRPRRERSENRSIHPDAHP
ncbi:hypothetical protein ACX80W_03345 [Arthrobacter sp. TMN-37]